MPVILPSLKALRESAGLTQEELARAAGVSLSTVFKHEQGAVSGVGYDTLSGFACALGVPPYRLFLPENSEGSK